ncbi:MAG: phosphatidate cytidylyltransferase [Paucibacter sp.]|nr:phosphatidate cytidylyltransferase [Roseateles sp.]
MLKTRIITAAILLALLLPALFASSPWPFAALTLLMIGAAGWEWARLCGVGGAGAWLLGAVVAAACGATFMLLGTAPAPAWCWWLAGAIWVLGGTYALRCGPAAWPKLALAPRLVLGVLVLWAAWAAMNQARSHGLNYLLSIFCLVWVADVAAYFGGRTLGRNKLAPAISPGKSWEGVWSGMAGVLLLAYVWTHWIDKRLPVDSPSLFGRLLWNQHGAVVALELLFLAAMSVVGDLFESLIKRAVGAKDSSGLLPGHGGVLDRVDALLPVLPLALALSSL